MAEAGLPGATAAFQLADGRVGVAAAGLADVEAERPMPADAVMPAGSVGKSFVACVALKLVEEGTLRLDAPIAGFFADDPWFAGLPNASALTLRALLNHSSGIAADVLSQPAVLEAFAATVHDGVDLGLSHEDLVRGLSGAKASFAVGEGFAYSDANYVLVGLLLERATKRPYEELLAELVLKPNGLASVTPTRRELERLPAGYRREGASYARLMPAKLTADGKLVYDPGVEWTGGGLATGVADLAPWGRLLSAESMREVLGSAKGDLAALGFRYGLGVQVFEEDGRTLLGHGGWIFGYVAGVLYDPEQDVAVAVQVNQPTHAYEGMLRSLLELVTER